jgi:hypothetical protein
MSIGKAIAFSSIWVSCGFAAYCGHPSVFIAAIIGTFFVMMAD